MNKYYDYDRQIIYTEDELLESYEKLKRNGEISPEIDNFNQYLDSCLIANNGTLEKVAPDWMIERLRRAVANDLACPEMSYSDILAYFQSAGIFGTWTVYEINHRPVDVDEVRELAEENLIGY